MAFIHAVTLQPLSAFVDFLWLSEGYVQPHAAERVLPTGRMDLVLGLDERGRIGNLVSGARTGSIVLDTSEPLSLMGVRFKAGGGFPFFGRSAGELQDQTISLEECWGPASHVLQERLHGTCRPATRFQILETALLERMARRSDRNPAVRYALEAFQRSETMPSVASVIEKTGLTARRFIATFRDEVGLTPKVFSRICRFRRSLGAMEPSSAIDWAAIALDCGYFDQPHFNHDFREFAGLSPSDYIRDRTPNPNHVRMQD